ncbi:MAG: sigma-54 dependent transcriptional regulator, partial [Bacteroidota bacterium]
MRGETLLVVEDERLIRWSIGERFRKAGFRVAEAATLAQARAALASEEPDLVLLDQILPDGTGLELLRQVKESGEGPAVVMLTAVDRSAVAVEAMKLGASDYLTKPVRHEELEVVVEKVLEETRMRRRLAHLLRRERSETGFCGMAGCSTAIRRVFEDLARIARTPNTTVLLTGESGTGKELAARAVHMLSPRREEPMLTVACSALAETLVESELFGHEKGAFTDASQRKKGTFELADGGTIFLDEIGDVSPRIQVRLLRVLEQKTFQRVGGTAEIRVNVRIIAATNRPLEEKTAEGSFREDLYYRLNVVRVHLPPLREREGDVLLLADMILAEMNARFRKNFREFAPGTRELLAAYRWPGNVRELRNVLERAVLLKEGDVLSLGEAELPGAAARRADSAGEPGGGPK